MQLTITNADNDLLGLLEGIFKLKPNYYNLIINEKKDMFADEIKTRVQDFKSGKMQTFSQEEFDEKLEDMYKQKYEKYHL